MNQLVAMTGSIAHEIKQPIAAIVANAKAGLRWLERTNPDVDETRAVLQAIVRDGHRVDGVINGIRTMFKGNPATRVSVDLNELLHEVLVFAQGEHRLGRPRFTPIWMKIYRLYQLIGFSCSK